MFKGRKIISLLLALIVVFYSFSSVFPAIVYAANSYSYESTHWLYIGWENDYPKSRTYMGGGVQPGMGAAIQYTLTIDGTTYFPDEFAADRKSKILWYLRDGYQPCPTSEWDAGPAHITIQHFANRILEDSATAVYSRVTVENTGAAPKTIRININAGTGYEVPLSEEPTYSDSGSMYYDVTLAAGETLSRDFAARAAGTATAAQLKSAGTFDSNYSAMSAYYNNRIDGLAHPVELPDQKQVDMYKAQQIVMWETMVKTNNANNPLFVFNWFTVGSTTVEAESYSAMSGIATENCGEGTLQIKNINDGDWLVYNNYNFGTGQSTFSARCASDYMNGHSGAIELRLDSLTGPVIGTCNVEPTAMNQWTIYKTFNTAITETSGVHNLYLIFKKTGSDDTNYEVRGEGGGGHYDRIYTHDVVNMVDQFIREGDYELAKRVLESPYYLQISKLLYSNYLDAIPKYILPYATYLKNTGDTSFFTGEVMENIRNAAHNIENYRYYNASDPNHYGIFNKSNTFDNGSNFLVVDNFAALSGLQAYKYISDQLGISDESQWAVGEMIDLNDCLNNALDIAEARRGVNWYMSNFDDSMYWPNYTGNYLATTFSMSTFPWDAYLSGFELGGTWLEHLDNSIGNALTKRTQSGTPVDSWGAWSVGAYGNVYNAGAGLQCMRSDTYRTEAIKNLEWMMKNQSAPYQWGESFHQGLNADDWTSIDADYETWGLSFQKQALLETNCSVKVDGTVIIGRGLPDQWIANGKKVQWANVNVNNNKKIDFTITGGTSGITLDISGDIPEGDILFNLPIFKNNIASSSAGTVDNASGTVILPAGTASVTVELVKSEGSLSVEAASALLTSSALNPAQSKDTNIVTMAQALVDAVYGGITVTLSATGNPAIDINGNINYGNDSVTGEVTFNLTKDGNTKAVTVMITVPGELTGAAAMLTSTALSPVQGRDTNLVARAQSIVNSVYGGITVALGATANTSIGADGKITFDVAAAAGNVTFALSKNGDTKDVTVAITVPPDNTGPKFEAENAILVGCNTAKDLTGFSGTGFVAGLNAIGDSITFNVNAPAAGKYNVDMRYGNGSSTKTISIYVNGVKIKQSSYPATGGWSVWSDVIDVLTLNEGNNVIMYKADSGDTPGFNPDYIYVAPDAGIELTQAAGLFTSAALSPVQGLHTNMVTLAQSIVNAAYSGITVTLTASENSAVDSAGNITYSGTATTGNMTFKLAKGGNSQTVTVSVTVPADSGGPKFEAENAVLVGCNVANDVGGYSGTGFVAGLNAIGDSITFTVNVPVAGKYNVDMRYGNGTSAKTLSIYVNGVKIKQTSYPSTGSWSTWGDVTEVLTLNAGTNTIMYRADTGDTPGLNPDYIIIAPDGDLELTQAAGLLASAALTPVQGIDTNIAAMAQALVDTVYGGINVTLETTANPAIGADGNITYGSTNTTGNVTFKLVRDGNSYPVTVSITVPADRRGPKFEAEDAVLVGCNTANNLIGYSGTGFVASLNAVGDSVAFTVNVPAAGKYNVDMRYSNGAAAKSLSIYVNGVKIRQSGYPSTGDWNTWGDVTESLTLSAGNNIIMYKADVGDTPGINPDYIFVTPDSGYEVEQASGLLASTGLAPVQGTDENIVTMAQVLVDTAYNGITVTLGATGNSAIAADGNITYGAAAATGDVTFNLEKNGTAKQVVVSVTVPADSGTAPGEETDLEGAESLLANATLAPVQGTDINIVAMAQALVNAAYTGITVTLEATGNPSIAADGNITYGAVAATGDVTFNLEKNGTAKQVTVRVTVPAGSGTVPGEETDLEGAAGLLTSAALTPVQGVDINIVTMAQELVDTAYAGINVSLEVTSSSAIDIDGNINYGSTAVTGVVILQLERDGSSRSVVVSVTVPADGATEPEETAELTGAANLLSSTVLTPVQGTDINIAALAQALVNAAYNGITVRLMNTGNSAIGANGSIVYGSTAVTGIVVLQLEKNGSSRNVTVYVNVPADRFNDNGNTGGNNGGNNAGGSSGSGNSSSNNGSSAGSEDKGKKNNDTLILINGNEQGEMAAASIKTGEDNITNVTLDPERFNQLLQKLENGAVVTISEGGASKGVSGELNGQTVKNMENKHSVLELRTIEASYKLPAELINIDAVSQEMGKNVKLSDIKVLVSISKLSAAAQKDINNAVKNSGLTLIADPVSFTVKCIYGDKTIDIKNFNSYVERTIAVPSGYDAAKTTTGVVIDPDGTIRHVPTKIINIDGKYYAGIRSLTNSNYAVVSNSVQFKDVDAHWAGNAVNDMGSRLIISGVGNSMFAPGKEITRSEFVAIIIRALGIPAEEYNNEFTDVIASDWYCGYIETAASLGIINGYGNGKFGPNDHITREQAMTIIAKAMKITGAVLSISPEEAGVQLQKYSDAVKVSAYARESVAACLDIGIVSGRDSGILAPEDYVTRAEVAVMVQKLLQKSNLI